MVIPQFPFKRLEVPVKNTFLHYDVKHWNIPAELRRQRTWPTLEQIALEDVSKLKLRPFTAKKVDGAPDPSPEVAWTSVSHEAGRRSAQDGERQQAAFPEEAGPIHMQWSSKVGIEDDSTFRVVRRLLGPGGQRMKAVSRASEGAKVWLQGRGARLGAADRSGAEPLEICVHAVTRSSFTKAVQNAQALLIEIHEEHREFLSKAAALPKAAAHDAVVPQDAQDFAMAPWAQKSSGEAAAPSATVSGSRPAVPERASSKFERRLDVGVEEDSQFRVVRRLLGPGGENMQHITREANRAHPGADVRVSIRGRGVHRSPGCRKNDSEEPLALVLTASSEEALAFAASMAEDLIADARKAYGAFKRSDHMA